MPSKTVKQLLGEAKPVAPSALFQQAYPTTGSQQNLKWRVHRVVGCAPTNIDPDDFDNWLMQAMESNVDSDAPVNEFDSNGLAALLRNETDPLFVEYLRGCEQVMRHTGADRVALTSVEGLE